MHQLSFHWCWCAAKWEKIQSHEPFKTWSAFVLWTHWQQPVARSTARTEKSWCTFLSISLSCQYNSCVSHEELMVLTASLSFPVTCHHADLPISLNILNYFYGFSCPKTLRSWDLPQISAGHLLYFLHSHSYISGHSFMKPRCWKGSARACLILQSGGSVHWPSWKTICCFF